MIASTEDISNVKDTIWNHFLPTNDTSMKLLNGQHFASQISSKSKLNSIVNSSHPKLLENEVIQALEYDINNALLIFKDASNYPYSGDEIASSIRLALDDFENVRGNKLFEALQCLLQDSSSRIRYTISELLLPYYSKLLQLLLDSSKESFVSATRKIPTTPFIKSKLQETAKAIDREFLSRVKDTRNGK